MTKQDFIHYLSYPEKLNGQSIDALEKLVRDYPYFQMGRMLYLKNLHNQNSIDYEKNLHITSAYAPGGKVLYNLIKKKKAEKSEVRSEKLEVEIKTDNKQLTVDNQQPETSSRKPAVEILPKEDTLVILQEIPANRNEKDLPTSPEVTEPKKDEFDELQLLEKEMLREAHRTSLTIDLMEEKTEDRRQKTETVVNYELRTANSKTYSFTDWLKVVSGKTTEPANQDILAAPTPAKKSKSEIIDKFILDATAKSAVKPKAEFYTAENMAKKSLQDNEVFVSETLASIYLKQGNLPKALRAYEILIVKHPEKIHIFAPLLEKIKKLLEDQKGK